MHIVTYIHSHTFIKRHTLQLILSHPTERVREKEREREGARKRERAHARERERETERETVEKLGKLGAIEHAIFVKIILGKVFFHLPTQFSMWCW